MVQVIERVNAALMANAIGGGCGKIGMKRFG
jgi:hypothetical protein